LVQAQTSAEAPANANPSFDFIKSDELREAAVNTYHNAVSAFETKSSFVERMGEIFEMDGMEKTEISVKLKEVYGYIVAPRTIEVVCKQHKWVDPSKSHGAADDAADDTSDSPHDDEPDFKQRCELNPSTVPFYSIRWPYWHAMSKMRDILKICMDELEKDADQETTESGETVLRPRNWGKLFESADVKKEYHKAIADMFYNIEFTSKKCMDKRQSILPFMLFPFIAKLSTTTIKHFASKYFVNIKTELTDITTKKTTQFLNSEDSVSALLQSVIDDGWKWFALDMKCPTCKEYSLQTKIFKDGTWKFVCKNWDYHKQEVYFEPEKLQHRINLLTQNRFNAANEYLKARNIPTSV
jgi:hypothetical protein